MENLLDRQLPYHKKRFFCNKCQGPKIHTKSYLDYKTRVQYCCDTCKKFTTINNYFNN